MRFVIASFLFAALTSSVAIGVWGLAWEASDVQPKEPVGFHTAMRVVQDLGLHYEVERNSPLASFRVVVSEGPLTHKDCSELCIGCSHERWAGKVAIHFGWSAHDREANLDPLRSTIWGETFVYGDPDLIRKLVARGTPR